MVCYYQDNVSILLGTGGICTVLGYEILGHKPVFNPLSDLLGRVSWGEIPF